MPVVSLLKVDKILRLCTQPPATDAVGQPLGAAFPAHALHMALATSDATLTLQQLPSGPWVGDCSEETSQSGPLNHGPTAGAGKSKCWRVVCENFLPFLAVPGDYTMCTVVPDPQLGTGICTGHA